MAEVHFPKPSPDKKEGECELASTQETSIWIWMRETEREFGAQILSRIKAGAVLKIRA